MPEVKDIGSFDYTAAVTKNDTSIALSCPQNRTARRVASYERLRFGKLNGMVRVRLQSRHVVRMLRPTPHCARFPSSPVRPFIELKKRRVAPAGIRHARINGEFRHS